MSTDTDVNYLLFRQQISLIRAQSSASLEGKAAYEGLAQSYNERVDAYKRLNEKMSVRAH
ncbi:hypothetical protein [Sphingobium sp.]|uniref:hypothetical protein n=1 Tax=Sphingobium sp. TaxID=1912891 RepID=UPI003BB49313